MNKDSIKNISVITLSICAWIVIWDFVSFVFDFEVIFPGPLKTFNTLIQLVGLKSFWKSTLYSFVRIFLGLVLGVIFGTVFTILSKSLSFANTFISIGMSVVKSTPVASIVLILWIIVDGSNNLPIIIALLMVSPIIWQNLSDGFNSIDKNLLEVARVFGFSKKKTVKVVYTPTLLNHFIPALLTSIGLAWKAGISAEVISYTKNSIGRVISDAKANFDGDVLFAWTIVVVLISLVLEYSARSLLRRFNTKNA